MNVQMTRPKTEAEQAIMREGAAILKVAQNAVKAAIAPGVTLISLDTIAEKVIRDAGAVPSFKGFSGFPATLCTMINEQVVHGIPDETQLKRGDLLSVDCGVLYKGLHTDAAFSLVVGGAQANPKREKFQSAVYSALLAGCDAAVAGARVGAIGEAVARSISAAGYRVMKEYTGHGIGVGLHEEPNVFNFGSKSEGMILQAGMTLCIEPIIAMGKPGNKTLDDGWTVVTTDGRDACQWEHCGIVQEGHFEILV